MIKHLSKDRPMTKIFLREAQLKQTLESKSVSFSITTW